MSDTFNIVYEYLKLEEFLILCSKNSKLIKKYKLPTEWDSINNNNIETLKYLINLGSKTQDLFHTSDLGFNMINYMFMTGFSGNLRMAKYLVRIGVDPANICRFSFLTGNLDIIKHYKNITLKNIKEAIIQVTLKEHIHIIEYLVEIGYKPDQWNVHYALQFEKHKVLEYYATLGIKFTKMNQGWLDYYPKKFEYQKNYGI